MLCVSVLLSSNEWVRIQQAAAKQFPNETLSRRLVILTLLLVAGVVSSVCQAPVKSSFSLSIRAHDREVPSGDRIELQITKTNLSGHVLFVGGNRTASYTFDVRRNGVLLPETDEAENLRDAPSPMIDGNLPPHQWVVDFVGVNEFRDMRQPGVYTIQVREDGVKSNTVTVTVTP